MKSVEAEVAELEKEKAAIEQELTSPDIYSDTKKVEGIQARFTKIISDLEVKNSKWEELMLQIEDLSEE